MVLWEIRKVGQHFLDLKTTWMALSFGKILAPPPPVCFRSGFHTVPNSETTPPLFSFREMSLNLYKTNKNGVAFVKGGGDGTEFRAPSSPTQSVQAPSCGATMAPLCCSCSVAKSSLTLCHPMDCSLPGSSVHGT